MPIQDEDIATLTLLLSPERLGLLTQLTGSAKVAIELHQETLSLGASLMAVTATLEIALRNSICENLSQHFGVPRWLQNPPLLFAGANQNKRKSLRPSIARAARNIQSSRRLKRQPLMPWLFRAEGLLTFRI